MRLLVIGLDKSVAEPASVSAQRQREYYRDWEVDICLLSNGISRQVSLSPGIKAHQIGGANRLLVLVNSFFYIRRLLHSKIYDAITVQDPFWCGLVAYLANSRQRIPWQIQDHSGFFARPPFTFTERCLRPFAIFFVRQATRIRTVSQRGLCGLQENGVTRAKIDVIPVVTALQPLLMFPESNRSQVKCVLSVGRLEAEKGYEVLLKAWQRAGLAEAELVIVGAGSKLHSLQQLVIELEIQSSVRFIGLLTAEELAVWWQRADLYVQPSWFEGWSRSLLEAAAVGLPIVSTDVGLIGEILRAEREAIVVRPGDVAGLAKALGRLSRDQALRQRLGQQARQTVLSWNQQAQDTIERVRVALLTVANTASTFPVAPK